MVGREVVETVERSPARLGDTVLEVTDIEALNDRELPALRRVLHDPQRRDRRDRGDRRQRAERAGGGDHRAAGMLRASGSTAATSRTPRPASDPPGRRPYPRGPDRRRQRAEPVGRRQPHHEVLPNRADRPRVAGRHDQGARRRETMRERYAIATPSIDTEVRLLSGGNLQRLILAREIESEPELIIAVQPTRASTSGRSSPSIACSWRAAPRARRSS